MKTIPFRLQIRALAILAILVSCAPEINFAAEPLQPIHVSDNGHYFVKADGTPFFWLADTAWSIFDHPQPADVDIYLNDRAAKGFTVIQGVIALWDYTRHTNCDGQLPFVNGDLGRINEAYYKNVDSVLDKVEAHGMYMAILPYWHKNAGDRLSVDDTPEKMQAYCKFLAQRYARRNVFWILGGDSTADGEAGEKIQHITDLEAQGLIEGARAAGVDKIMISYHPTGRQSSSFWFQDSPWLDFNSIQSGHFIRTTNFRLVANDFEKTPAKPTLDMEPGYENITDGLVRNRTNATRIAATDVRRSAYLAVFAGAAGHSYGCGEVYEFWSPETRGPLPGWGAGLPWRESLKLPGSSQVQYVRYLIESRPMLDRIPDQSLLAEGDLPVLERVEATRSADGSYGFVYTTDGKSFQVRTGKLSGKKLVAWWYDPRTGKAKKFGSFAKTDTREFTPPSSGIGNDWVLVLDDAKKKYPAPGLISRGTRNLNASSGRNRNR
jgi:Protein of unknown function (DUF4038)/Putative collagen-binding domain of a collagenase